MKIIQIAFNSHQVIDAHSGGLQVNLGGLVTLYIDHIFRHTDYL